MTEFEYIRNKAFTIYFGKFYDEGRPSNQIITIYSPNGVDFVQYDENDRKETIEALSAWLKSPESFRYEYTFEEKDWTDDFAYAVFKITIDTLKMKFKIEPFKINVTQKSRLEKAIEDGVLLGIDKWHSLEEFTSFAKRMGFKVENAGKVGPGQHDSFNFFAKLGNKFYGSFDDHQKSGFLYFCLFLSSLYSLLQLFMPLILCEEAARVSWRAAPNTTTISGSIIILRAVLILRSSIFGAQGI